MAETAEVTLDKEIKDDNRIVAGWLLWYHERRHEYLNRRTELIHSTPRPEGPNGGQTFRISDSTGQKGSKLADLEKTEQWLGLVAEVEQRLPWKMQIFLRLRREYRYARGRKGWTAAVQWKFAQEVADRVGKRPEDTWVESRETFSRWWDKIVDYTARLAAKRGLL